MRHHRTFAAAAVLLCGLAAAGCGAGLITGAAVSNRGGSSTPSAPPSLSLPETVLPLVPGESALAARRAVLVSNVRVEGSLRVQLRAAGVAVDQANVSIDPGQGSTTVVGFELVLQPIVAAIGDPTLADVNGQLAVLADGRELAPPVPVLLAQQPVAALATLNNAPRLFLSPLGGTVARLLVRGLRAPSADGLEMLVSIADPDDPSRLVTRPCTGLTLEPAPTGGAFVSASVPGNVFPGPVSLVVQDVLAGRSTAVGDAFYGPDVALALPGQGPTTGGSLVTLIGTALVPLDFGQVPARKDFNQVELLFRKGGRELRLPAQDLRQAVSGLDRLVFTMPASPDGRPGNVDIVLRLLGQVQAETTATEVFLFANPQPVFGPRGAVLDQRPVAITPIQLEGAPGGSAEATDLAVLSTEGGVGYLQMLLAEENGMFIRGGAPRRLGDPEVEAERNPAGVCSGDFNGDGVPDLFVVNRGGEHGARHHLVLGQQRPLPPLGALSYLDGAGGNTACRAGDFDGDGIDDLLLLPGEDATVSLLPQVWLARPLQGQPFFVRAADLPVRPGFYGAATLARLDAGDTVDIALLGGGTVPRLEVVFGDGDGRFGSGSAQHLDLVIPGQDPGPGVQAVGIHACGDPLQVPRPLVVLVGGQPGSTTTPNIVAVLHADLQGVFQQPSPSEVLPILFGTMQANAVADLDSDPAPELLFATTDAQIQSLFVFDWAQSKFQPAPNSIELGAERLLSIASLHTGLAFPAGAQPQPVRGVFVVHDSETDGLREPRVSTLLVGERLPTPLLSSPDLGGGVQFAVASLLGGNFSATSVAHQGRTRDLALASANKIDIRTNDGFGGVFTRGPELVATGIVPETLAVARLSPRPPGEEALAYFGDDGRLWLWEPLRLDPQGQSPLPPQATGDLRLLCADPTLRSLPPSPRSRIAVADVDGDGVRDLVALLAFDRVPAPREGDALLLLLRGKPNPAASEFPFEQPVAAMPVHGSATAFALGDFAPGPLPMRLELALVVPQGSSVGAADGDHVRFYRYAPGASAAADRLVRSGDAGGAQVLLAGSAPTQLAAGDFDRNGTVDLLVASQGDAALHLLLNNGMPAAAALEVNVDAFHESLASPVAAAPGRPTRLLVGDINGDRIEDVLLATESISNNVRSTAVAFFLSSGTGEFDRPVFVSPTRLGSTDLAHRDTRLSVDLADLNDDAVPDLAVGWNTFGSNDRNVRVLFGGSR